MIKLHYIVILSLLLTIACTEEEPVNENNTYQPDVNMSKTDVGVDADEDTKTQVTNLPTGEKLTGFSAIELNVDKVVLRQKGGKIFLVINEQQQVWTQTDKVDLTPFYTWPDNSLLTAVGNMSADISMGDQRLWFVGQDSDKTAAIFGAKYIPATSGSKTFGDPVVIFNVGPGNNFSGIGIWQDIIAAGIRGTGSEKDRVVFAGTNIETTTIEVPGFHSTSSFRVASHGGVYAYDNSVWKISFQDKKVKRLTSTGKVRDVRTTDRFLYLRTDSGLGKLAVDCSEPCVPEKLTEGFSPQNWDANDDLVAWNEGEIIRTFKDGKLSSVAQSKAPVLSILVKNSDIYWATKDGLYVLK